jgi:hypothetical protein
MRKVILVCLLLGACTKHDDYPVGGGGGGGTGSMGGGGDDAPTGGDGNDTISGRVCLVTDLRTPRDGCAATGADGLTVTLGIHTATTSANGSFTMPTPVGTGGNWQVTGGSIVESVMPAGGVATIPAISKTAYDTLAGDNGVATVDGQGTIVASVIHDNIALRNVSVTPATQFGPLYDAGSATVWALSPGTGDDGGVWIPDAAAGLVNLTFTPQTPLTPVQATNIPVVDHKTAEAITFITVEL